jgi:hypothetical protein
MAASFAALARMSETTSGIFALRSPASATPMTIARTAAVAPHPRSSSSGCTHA